MIDPQLLNYVKQQLAQNVSKEKIKTDLMAGGGWTISDIDKAFSVSASPNQNLSLTMKCAIAGVVLGLVIDFFIVKGCFYGSCGPEVLSLPVPIILFGLLGGGIGKAWGSRWGRIIVTPILIMVFLYMVLGFFMELSG
jgi:hypothetical protein